MSNSLWPCRLQHARFPCPSPTHYFPLFYFLPVFLRAKHAESTQVRVSLFPLNLVTGGTIVGTKVALGDFWSWVVRGNAASAWLSGHLSFSPEPPGRKFNHPVERARGKALQLQERVRGPAAQTSVNTDEAPDMWTNPSWTLQIYMATKQIQLSDPSQCPMRQENGLANVPNLKILSLMKWLLL